MEKPNAEKDKDTSAKSYNQWIATLAVSLLMFQIGIQSGWLSPNVARFLSEESPFPMTKNQVSWVISLNIIVVLIGALPTLIAFEVIGGRRVILISLIANSLSSMCLIAANSVVWVYIARLFAGVAGAGAISCYAIFLGEVARPKIRGTLISIAANGSSVGFLFAVIVETYVTSMKVSGSIYLVTCVIAIGLFIWLKDSPYYFAKKGDFESAEQSIAFYLTGCDVAEELSSVKAFVKASGDKSVKDRFKELRSPATRKSVFLIFVCYSFPHISGQGNVMSYMEVILKRAKFDVVKPKEFVIYATIISIVANSLTVRISDKLGRRPALIMSGIGASIAMTCLGLNFYLLKENVDVQSLQWLPIFSIIFMFLSYALGYCMVPGIVLSELFPQNIKSLAACFAIFSASTFEFISRHSFQPVVDAFGEEYMFWLHAGLSLLSIPFALFLLPETKGKNFEQIQNDLKSL